MSSEFYEPNEHDRHAAIETARRIAGEMQHIPPAQMSSVLEMKIEAAILSELSMRGIPRSHGHPRVTVPVSVAQPAKPFAKPERRPGDQVAPGQKPLYRPGLTASTHSRVPLDQATAGKLYRVRDRDDGVKPPTVWIENVSYTQAQQVKDSVAAQRKSKTARIEPMPSEADADGPAITLGLPDGRVVEFGDYEQRAARPDEVGRADPQLAAMRATAMATSRSEAAAAQQRHERMRTAMADPPKPPPSPLTDEVLGDLPDLDADLPQLEEGDLQDIVGSVGAASDEDKAHFRKQSEMSCAETQQAAMKAYDQAAKRDSAQGPWPAWNRLGEYEWAAWRFFVANGGTEPELVKHPRKVQHAMGDNT